MSRYDDFLRNQIARYWRLRDLANQAGKNGLQADPALIERKGGFFVSLIYHPEDSQRLAEISDRVATDFPATVYDFWDIHTTLAGISYQRQFSVNPGRNPEHRDLLERISGAVGRALEKCEPPIVCLGELLATPCYTVCLAEPDSRFVHLVDAIGKELSQEGIDVSLAEDAHITLNRFWKKTSLSSAIHRLQMLLQAAGLAGRRCHAQGVSVGYSLWEPTPQRPDLKPEDACGHFVSYRNFVF